MSIEIFKNLSGIRKKENILIITLVLTTLYQIFYSSNKISIISPDPYFHLKNMNIVSIIGMISSVILIVYMSFLKKGKNNIYLNFFSLIMLFFNMNFMPLFKYVNNLYTDTYIFVGELYYLLTNGVFGWGHAEVTPGLSLLSGQISLISDLDHIIISEIMQFIFPLMMIFFIYFFTSEILNDKAALFASFAYVSSNWMNHIFHFNRQSIGLVMQIFLYYILWMIIKSEENSNKEIRVYIFVYMLSFLSITLIHSLSSLLVVFNLFIYLILSFIIKNIVRYNITISNRFFKPKIFSTNMFSISAILFVLSSIIWVSWSIFTQENVRFIIQALLQTMNAFSFQPNPISEGTKFVTGYTNTYYPIILLRTSEAILYTAISFLILIYISIKQKIDQKMLFLITWYFSSFLILPSGLWTGHFIERAFLHLFPAFSILLSIFLFDEIFTATKISKIKSIPQIIGTVLVFIVIIFSFLLPITKYSNTPFMYAPTVYLHQNNFLAEHATGSVAVMGESSVTGYYTLLNNKTNLFTNVPYNSTSILDMDTIMISFRVYTRAAFVPEAPIYSEIRAGLDQGTYFEQYYSRVYDADDWHHIYRRYGN